MAMGYDAISLSGGSLISGKASAGVLARREARGIERCIVVVGCCEISVSRQSTLLFNPTIDALTYKVIRIRGCLGS